MDEHETQQHIDDLQKQLTDLKALLEGVSQEFYKNNFATSQDFSKYSRFNSRLKIPVVSALLSTCEVGEVVSQGGKLYHCSSANTWTSQT